MFFWDYKRSCHYWKAETKKENKDTAIKIADINAERELIDARLKWKLETRTKSL